MVEHGRRGRGAQAQFHGVGDLPGPGIGPGSPALAGRLYAEPPGKPTLAFFTREHVAIT